MAGFNAEHGHRVYFLTAQLSEWFLSAFEANVKTSFKRKLTPTGLSALVAEIGKACAPIAEMVETIENIFLYDPKVQVVASWTEEVCMQLSCEWVTPDIAAPNHYEYHGKHGFI